LFENERKCLDPNYLAHSIHIEIACVRDVTHVNESVKYEKYLK